MSGESFKLEEPLCGNRIGGEKLGELVDLAGSERDVDKRKAREHFILDRLRPAAADTDDAVGILALQPLGVAEVSDEPIVGLLSDRARVEEDEVGVVLALGLGVAERLEHALHPLRVVRVHLAAERRDVVALM